MTMLQLALLFACGDKQDDTAHDDTEEQLTDTEVDDTDVDDTEDTDDVDDTDDTGVEIQSYSVDSTDSTIWVYFDLSTGTVVEPSNPEDSTEWDLKFQRYSIGTNGGISGSGSVQVMIQEGVYESYETLDTMPEGGEWIVDSDVDGDGTPEYAMGDWYNYDFTNHSLSPLDLVYFVQTNNGTFKFRMVDYYNDVGESGLMTFDTTLME